MLNHISWLQFIEAVIVLSACWYGFVFLKFRQPKPVQQTAFIPQVASASSQVMGGIKADTDTYLEDPATIISSAEIIPDDIDDETVAAGPTEELVAEASILMQAFEQAGEKQEFLTLLQLLFNKYQSLSGQIDLPKVIDQLKKAAKGRLPFIVKATEWPTTF